MKDVPSDRSILEEDPVDFIRLSGRMSELPPYLFGKINRAKDGKRRDGVDVIDMAMGNPTDPTPEPIVEKLVEVVRDPRNHRYSAAAGIYNLRREVAKFYAREYDVDLDPDNEVLTVIGSKEGFSHLCLALLGPGEIALVPTPSFPIHVWGVVLAGGHRVGIPLADDERFLSELDRMCRTLTPRPKVLFLNYPHNPTGHSVDPAFFAEAFRIARRHELIVVHDFAYGQTCFDDYKAPSFLQTPGAKSIGVEFTTMSKAYNMAGWRIGYCCGNRKIISGLARVKGYYDYGVFQAIQIAAIWALRHCRKEALAQAKLYEERRDALIRGLSRIRWDVEPPRAAMFVWAPLPEEFREMGSEAFALGLMDDAEVAVAPGIGFGPEGEGYVRLALIENTQRINQAVRQIRRAFHTWRKEGPPGARKA
ncbi:MAG: aminotransferase class I/II-fold pyridoxal phosphate-dependent enzyme [Planctomycetes bacterium]|nr:aminotransferase class I/II-fold pyridoxal phosphate-dependent enzyme [Planctomycetota bacterium]